MGGICVCAGREGGGWAGGGRRPTATDRAAFRRQTNAAATNRPILLPQHNANAPSSSPSLPAPTPETPETANPQRKRRRQLRAAVAEYLGGGGGAGEVAQTLRDLAVPHFGHELVKAALEVCVCSCVLFVCDCCSCVS